MSKGLKKNFPLYAKMENVIVEGNCDISRLTPRTFAQFIKEKHGADANPDDYILLEMIKVA